MLKIFREETGGSPKGIVSGRESYLESRFQERFTRIAFNHRRSVYTVPSDHLLIQILQHLDTVTDSEDDVRFYNRVNRDAMKIASALDITSINHKQKDFRNKQFYPKGINEYYIFHQFGIPSGLRSKEHWQTFEPVQVIYHPMTSLNMSPRYGAETTNAAKGYAVIYIDPGLLALQYRRWREATSEYEVSPQIQQFVFQYPIINLIPTDTTVAFLNHYNVELGLMSDVPEKPTYSFSVPDIHNYIDEHIEKTLTGFSKVSYNLIQVAKVIYAPFENSLYDFLRFGQQYLTAQNTPYYAIGYLPWFILLGDISNKSQSKDNTAFHYNIRKRVEQYMNAGFFRNIPGLKDKELNVFIKQNLLEKL